MTQTIDYKGYKIKAYIEGAGEPIVLLHGWPTNALLWQAQVDHLKSQFKVITFDWLGFGQSDQPLDFPYAFPEMIKMLDVVLSKLVVPSEKISLVAHDIGGPPAILWSKANPGKVQRLILLNTVLYPFKTPLDFLSGIILSLPIAKDIFVSSFGLHQMFRTVCKNYDFKAKLRAKRILEAYLKAPASLKQNTLEGPLQARKMGVLQSLSKDFQKLSMERHLIIGPGDPLCFAHMVKLHQENSDVSASFIENCGHFIPIEQPDSLNDILSSILMGA